MAGKMKTSLLSIFLENQELRGESIFNTMKFAVLPVAKVFTMCFMGFLMASNYVNILSTNGRKLLNGLVFCLLLPCLIFSQLGRAITFQKLLEWWYIPVNVVIGSISGSLIGFIVAAVVQPPYPYFKFTIVHIGIGNIGNIPLVLIAALCRDESNPFGDPNKCNESGNAYISFGQWVGAIIVYTYVFQMLAPPNGETFDSAEEKEPPNKDPAAYGKLPSNAFLPNVEKRSIKVSFKDDKPVRVPLSPSVECEIVSSTSSKVFAKILIILNELKQPPIIASALAIFCGTIPFLKRLILKDDAPFFFLTDSCLILGEAMIPCILLALGGNLIDGPGVGSRRLGFRTMASIVFARLVLIPPVGLGIVTLVDKLGFIPNGDKMFKFVLLLQHTMPTSVISGAVANLQGCGKEAAAVLFWVHIFAVFSMAGWIILYLAILF
ncbi:protein PIN-LIKES 6-like [Phalaenopsis equestris]|uniref:protein PIN-LIKES 6-like n=1 Tax=Phalaenopsis equestris TaxID=78828 RepID=UPI0009E291E5|nr:protein PIN-LIKES 6-like [Phalaenopsis equestris]XP_020580772.1 protein PIN-LIKES 6-like [Phalaenopsis equestris]